MIPTDNTEFAPESELASSRALCVQIRRDLLWAVSSSDRWTVEHPAFGTGDRQRVQRWIDTLNDDCLLDSDLPRLQQRRLGHYFEALWLFYLERQHTWQLQLANQVVFDIAPNDKRTIGEIDFVLLHPATDHLLHLEIAVKFYLAVPYQHEMIWVGPSLQDNLQRKLVHLEQHQLPLGQHPDIIARLGRRPDEHRALIKGRGFWPSSTAIDDTPNDREPRDGAWLCVTDAIKSLLGHRIAVLHRREWLAGPAQPHWQTVTPDILISLAGRAPVQIWLEPDPSRSNAPEAMFIVPDDWLARAIEYIDEQRIAERPI
ncbi:MAG: DUF1853 family protein [Natronospirillum sp.]